MLDKPTLRDILQNTKLVLFRNVNVMEDRDRLRAGSD